jgi:hypothetical protein
MSSPVWVAITLNLIREVPSGEVGGLIARASTPASRNRESRARAASALPIMRGTIWVTEFEGGLTLEESVAEGTRQRE